MNDQVLITLKKKLEEIITQGISDVKTQRNALKEELQFYVLDFIYHHPEYSNWTMYGGSALRICHDLNRMSVDLDFEIPHPITEKLLNELKEEIENHFKNTYGSGSDVLTVKTTTGRGLKLKFHIGEELGIDHSSKQVHVKIDLNHFVAPKTVTERIPVNRDQLSFVIKTYNMSALMASKIAAIFLRGQRGVGEAVYEEKGRDIYDLLWYMTKKIVPDFDYLVAKDIDVSDPRVLFDKLTLQMNKVSDTNLKQDLTPLFSNPVFIENWLTNWRESYLRLLDEYKIRTVIEMESIVIHKDFHTDSYSFIYWYNTDDDASVRVIYTISEHWIIFREGDLAIQPDESIGNLRIEFSGVGWNAWEEMPDKIKQYVTLFHRKTKKYFKKTSGVILGDTIATKLVRMTADNLKQREQILLNKSALLSSELDDLLK